MLTVLYTYIYIYIHFVLLYNYFVHIYFIHCYVSGISELIAECFSGSLLIMHNLKEHLFTFCNVNINKLLHAAAITITFNSYHCNVVFNKTYHPQLTINYMILIVNLSESNHYKYTMHL